MSVINVNGVHLYYERTGIGEPLVLVHGSWSDHSVWDAIVPLLSERFDTVTYDRRGHSDSEEPDAQGSVAEDADDLAALIEALELAPAHVVANSFGALITLNLASRRHELLNRVALHEPPGFLLLAGDPYCAPVLEKQAASIGAVAAKLAAGEDEAGAAQFVDEVALGPGMWDRLPPEQHAMFVRNAHTFLDETQEPEALAVDLDAVSSFDQPVLLTYGDQSPPLFDKVVERLREALPNAEAKLIPGGGHVPQLTHPEPYSDVVSTFLLESYS